MLKLKKWNGPQARKKFARYRAWFGATAVLFLLTAALEMVFLGADVRAAARPALSPARHLVALFTGEALWYLLPFLTGVTVYAPALSLLAAAARGLSAGAVLSAHLPAGTGREGAILALTALYLGISTIVYLAYFAFCTSVSAAAFSAPPAGGEGEMFGGTLFFSRLTARSVNLRFFGSYLFAFAASLVVQAGLSALYAVARASLC